MITTCTKFKKTKTEIPPLSYFSILPTETQSHILSFSFFQHIKNPTLSKELYQSLKQTDEYQSCEKGKALLESAQNIDPIIIGILNNMYGYSILGSGLMTLDQATAMFPMQLKLLMSENGILGLQKEIFTLEEANNSSEAALRICLNDKMFAAFRKKYLTFNNVNQMQIAHLQLLADNLFVLEENLLTLSQIHNCTTMQLHVLFTPEGIEYLRSNKNKIDNVLRLSIAQLRATIREFINSEDKAPEIVAERRIFGF